MLKIPRVALTLIIITVSCHAGTWWQKPWHYRFSVTVETGDFTCTNRVAELPVNFAEKFAETGYPARQLLVPTIRVIEVTREGKLIAERLAQFDDGVLLWLLDGQSAMNGKRFFQVYFNASDAPVPPSPLAPLVCKTDSINRWQFHTPGGYYVYEKKGGAFEVFSPVRCQDNEPGKDWQRDDYSRGNGILNIGDPDTHAIFHPNEDSEADDGTWKGALSVQLHGGPLRYRIKSVNRFADLGRDFRSNTTYEIWYDILPYGIRATLVHGNAAGFACIMACTPGGDKLEADDYVMTGNGERNTYGRNWAQDLSPEWLYIGDADDHHQVYFIHAEDDTIKDGLNWYDTMQAVMAGWGRGANPGLHTYPGIFYLGFAPSADFPTMSRQVAGLLSPLKYVVAKAEVQQTKEWGSVTVDDSQGYLSVLLENQLIRCRFDTVQANGRVQTGIREFLLKKNRLNQSGNLLDETAGGSGNRGMLTRASRVLYDGADRKTVHLEWDDGCTVEEISIFPNQSFLRIEYLNLNGPICDHGRPGAADSGCYVVYGAEEWRRLRQNMPAQIGKSEANADLLADLLYPLYPNPFVSNPRWGLKAEENPLNYHGWYIMGLYNPENHVGYGRLMPAAAMEEVRLISGKGFEQIPGFSAIRGFQPFTEYLFAVTRGADEIIMLGKKLADQSNAEPWYRVDLSSRTMENRLLRISHGPSHHFRGTPKSGMDEFLYKPGSENFATVLDAYGGGFAKYAVGGPSHIELSQTAGDYIEWTLRVSDGVDVIKRERLFKDLPILEIQYDKLDLTWFQDFYAIEHTRDRLYTIYGVPALIDSNLQAAYRKTAEDHCGHNFGDCFLKAAGATVHQCNYKGYFIFGFHNQTDGRGLGFVMPVDIGLHSGFKLWNMSSYECFPFSKMTKVLPFKRWIFVTTQGREGILSIGQKIADSAAAGQTLQQQMPALLKVCVPQ